MLKIVESTNRAAVEALLAPERAQLLGSFESWWAQLATWQRLEPEQQRTLIHSIERAYKSNIEQLREARDRRLGAILRALEQARTA